MSTHSYPAHSLRTTKILILGMGNEGKTAYVDKFVQEFHHGMLGRRTADWNGESYYTGVTIPTNCGDFCLDLLTQNGLPEEAIAWADCVLVFMNQGSEESAIFANEAGTSIGAKSDAPIVRVVSKADLEGETPEPMRDGTISVSAATGFNIKAPIQQALRMLVGNPNIVL